jgi:hypothetical protein
MTTTTQTAHHPCRLFVFLTTLVQTSFRAGGQKSPAASVEIRSATGAANFDVNNAPAPLFRDPIFDGADDPTVVFDEKRKAW